jgi:hypothetical protein
MQIFPARDVDGMDERAAITDDRFVVTVLLSRAASSGGTPMGQCCGLRLHGEWHSNILGAPVALQFLKPSIGDMTCKSTERTKNICVKSLKP